MVRALDAIRECADLAWWDGSSVGLHLQGLAGLFGLVEVEASPSRVPAQSGAAW